MASGLTVKQDQNPGDQSEGAQDRARVQERNMDEVLRAVDCEPDSQEQHGRFPRTVPIHDLVPWRLQSEN
jgi:hypothetical protein